MNVQPNLKDDLLGSFIQNKVKQRRTYAWELYLALCNNVWQKYEIQSILSNKCWACSCRQAGEIVAELLEKGSYLDWYCSGGLTNNDSHQPVNLSEGDVTDEVKADLEILGWILANNVK